jgi:hypothetical protein
VSERDARLAEQRQLLPGSRFWQTVVMRDEADEDASWLVLDVPEADVVVHERPTAPELGYREFELPPDFLIRFVPSRA